MEYFVYHLIRLIDIRGKGIVIYKITDVDLFWYAAVLFDV
jgi:hypothetical protein